MPGEPAMSIEGLAPRLAGRKLRILLFMAAVTLLFKKKNKTQRKSLFRLRVMWPSTVRGNLEVGVPRKG